eukprot:scaffold193363_cov48-Prasinocladus_malaysianus.AAC.1
MDEAGADACHIVGSETALRAAHRGSLLNRPLAPDSHTGRGNALIWMTSTVTVPSADSCMPSVT